jgi:hypothetical protein
MVVRELLTRAAAAVVLVISEEVLRGVRVVLVLLFYPSQPQITQEMSPDHRL